MLNIRPSIDKRRFHWNTDIRPHASPFHVPADRLQRDRLAIGEHESRTAPLRRVERHGPYGRRRLQGARGRRPDEHPGDPYPQGVPRQGGRGFRREGRFRRGDVQALGEERTARAHRASDRELPSGGLRRKARDPGPFRSGCHVRRAEEDTQVQHGPGRAGVLRGHASRPVCREAHVLHRDRQRRVPLGRSEVGGDPRPRHTGGRAASRVPDPGRRRRQPLHV